MQISAMTAGMDRIYLLHVDHESFDHRINYRYILLYSRIQNSDRTIFLCELSIVLKSYCMLMWLRLKHDVPIYEPSHIFCIDYLVENWRLNKSQVRSFFILALIDFKIVHNNEYVGTQSSENFFLLIIRFSYSLKLIIRWRLF